MARIQFAPTYRSKWSGHDWEFVRSDSPNPHPNAIPDRMVLRHPSGDEVTVGLGYYHLQFDPIWPATEPSTPYERTQAP